MRIDKNNIVHTGIQSVIGVYFFLYTYICVNIARILAHSTQLPN